MLSRYKPTILLLTFLAFSAVCVTQPRGVPLPYKSKALHKIKKLYVVDMGFEFVKTHDASGHRILKEDEAEAYLQKEHARYQGMAALLEPELTRVGFAVVKDFHEADAELVGAIRPGTEKLTEVDLRRHYTYRLVPPANGHSMDFFNVKDKLCETDFKLSPEMTTDDRDKNAAVKVADALLNAWLTSAKKAGLTVGDKVQ